MTFVPLSDRVLLTRVEAKQTTPSGIIIPDAAQEKPLWCTVVAVGPGKVTESGSLIEPRVAAGQTVLISKYAGTDLSIDGVDHTIIREEDILGFND